jgi:ankyrin repeat protein
MTLVGAAELGKLDIVRVMVREYGADDNQRTNDEDAYTPLIVAAHKGHVQVVRCLVKEFGADINQAAAMKDGKMSVQIHGGWAGTRNYGAVLRRRVRC